MVSVWDRSRAVGGCFTMLRRTDFVCLSIAYSVTVWCWKCWLCFCLLCFSCHCTATTGTIKRNVFLLCLFSSWEWGGLIKWEHINAFRSGWTNLRLFILSPGGVVLLFVNSCFDFIWILLGLLHCGKHNALWPVLRANDLILLFPCLLLLIASTSEPENGCAAVITEAQRGVMGVHVFAIIYSIWARTEY